PEERPIFDRCFESFWRTQVEPDPLGQALAGPEIPEDMADAPIDSQGARRERLALEGWGAEEEEEEGGDPLSVPAASEQEALASRDFSTFSAEQLEEVLRLTVQIARRLARRVSRRRRPVRPRGPAAHAAGESDARRDHRAAIPAAQEAQGAARPAVRRLGLDGSLQP